MIPPPTPADEAARLAAVVDLALLDTGAEERFDRLTRLAARILGVPIALVSLIDDRRQWYKSRVGIDATEVPREQSFCGHAILDDELVVVPDALEDERFHDNPFVVGDPGVRFYAGRSLHAAGGERVGTLCVIDRVPRELSDETARRSTTSPPSSSASCSSGRWPTRGRPTAPCTPATRRSSRTSPKP